MTRTLYESGENYLEAIMVLKQRNGSVQSIDIANHMGFSKASVSRAVKILSMEGYITVGKGGVLDFTDKGRITATAIYDRHKVITQFLTEVLKVSSQTADQDACRIEHVISDETFEAIKNKIK